MKEKITLLLVLFAFCKSYSQVRRTEYINCAAFSNNVSCGVGEIFIIQEFTNKTEDEQPKEDLANNFKSYPNPVTDFLYFESSLEAKSVRIFSNDGKLIRSQDLTGSKSIDLSYLKAGLYILQFDNLKINPLKIIKN